MEKYIVGVILMSKFWIYFVYILFWWIKMEKYIVVVILMSKFWPYFVYILFWWYKMLGEKIVLVLGYGHGTLSLYSEVITQKILEMNTRGDSRINEGERGGWGE